MGFVAQDGVGALLFIAGIGLMLFLIQKKIITP
jgi:hypothetical protein